MSAAALIENLPKILAAKEVASGVISKYGPNIKTAVNSLFNRQSRKSAANYMRKLTTQQGLSKFIQKDAPMRLKQASDYLASGKGLKMLDEVSSDASRVLAAGKDLGINTSKLESGLSKGVENIKHAHEISDKYNQNLRNQLLN